MAAKIIMCSFSEGDKQFCRDKNLSPSKLLQERIMQIREDQSPALRDMIKEANDKIMNLSKKLSYSTGILNKVCEAAQTKIPEEEWGALIKNI